MDKIIIPEIDVNAMADTWNKKEYSKNGYPYGLIYTKEIDGILFVGSKAPHVDQSFTVDMLKDMVEMYNKQSICVISEVKSRRELLKKAMSRYDVKHMIKDDIMYSFGVNHGR